jgi:hypothetical protein
VYDEDLTNLDDWIRRLKIEYDIFFNGNRRKPPDDLRFRVEKIVKRLSEATDMSSSERFRYNTLIARFCVYRDLWRRTQQERESSREAGEETAAGGQAPPPESPPDEPVQGIEVSLRDPLSEEEKVRRLYDGLLRLRGAQAKDSPAISYQRFVQYIANQTLDIRKKHRCSSVTFRIVLEEHAIKFTAKADTSL